MTKVTYTALLLIITVHIVSDSQLKDIYRDMCYVNDYRKNKKQQHTNIVSAIRELGQ